MPKNKKDLRKIYERFGIEFIEKDGVDTRFKINNNDVTNDNIEDVAKVLCLFTIGLFETDSVERRIVYKRNGKFYCDTVDNVCEEFFTNTNIIDNQIDLPNESRYFGLDDDEKMVGFKEFDSKTKNVQVSNDVNILKHDYKNREDSSESDPDSEDDYDHMNMYRFRKENFRDAINKYPVTKLKIKKDMFTDRAEGGYSSDQNFEDDDDGDNGEFYDFVTDKSVQVDRLYNVQNDLDEVPGNWGDTLGDRYKKFSRKNIGMIFEERFPIFDFDKFGIEVNRESESETLKKFTCSFTPINGVHHAASMFARTCTVDFTMTDVTIGLVNSVAVTMIPNGNKYDVTATYYGVDVL